MLNAPETFSPPIAARKLPEATVIPFLEEKTEGQTAALLREMGKTLNKPTQYLLRLLSALGRLKKAKNIE